MGGFRMNPQVSFTARARDGAFSEIVVAEYAELMTTGVNRLPAPAWWAAALPKTAALAAGAGALLDEVERLRNCEPDPPPVTDELLRTELRGVYDALDRAMRERDALRAWEAEARAAMDRMVAAADGLRRGDFAMPSWRALISDRLEAVRAVLQVKP